MALKLWTREELILGLNLYRKLPFGKLHSRTPEIVQLAELVDRTPSSVAMRLNNFASVDPFHQQRGIGGYLVVENRSSQFEMSLFIILKNYYLIVNG